MPLLLISYALQFFDKTTLGYTAILGIQQDTVRNLGPFFCFFTIVPQTNMSKSISKEQTILGCRRFSTLDTCWPHTQPHLHLSSSQLANSLPAVS